MRFEQELQLAKEAAEKAGSFLMDHSAHVDTSVGKDIKLENDRKSEEIIVEILKTTDIPILSEERGRVSGRKGSELEWIVDPLDGSANFWKGMKELTCVSVALWENGEPVLGVVNRFYMHELFYGVVGEGAFLNGTPIHTSDIREAGSAVLATGFPVKRNYEKESLDRFVREIQVFKKVRMLGAAAVMGAFVSCGRIDVYREEDIMLWDIAASSALVKAAGGSIEIMPTGEDKCICSLYANESLKQSLEKTENS